MNEPWSLGQVEGKEKKKKLIQGIFVDQRKVECYSEPPFCKLCETGPRKITREDLLFAILCVLKMTMQLY
jgi:hypothetical protein